MLLVPDVVAEGRGTTDVVAEGRGTADVFPEGWGFAAMQGVINTKCK